MATGRVPSLNASAPTKSSLGPPMEKLPSNTLKRNPKMELGRTDLLKLLSYLEGELQAREVVIATLKAERVKQLLYQAKYGQFSLNDPFSALQRDSYAAYNPSCDEASIKAMYNNQLSQVENLILQHQKAQQRLRQHLREAEVQHAKVVTDLEDEIHKHAQDTAQGDDVTYFLEKDRDRLHQEVEMEREHNQKLEKELKKVVQAMEQDKLRHKQIVLLLLEDRKRIMSKLLDEHGRNEEMTRYLTIEKDRMAEVEEGLEEESKKSLVMEAELEKQAANFSIEKEQLRRILEAEVEKNRQLKEQVATLSQEMNSLRCNRQQNNPTVSEDTVDFRFADGELNASFNNTHNPTTTTITTTNTSSSLAATNPPPPPTPPKATSVQKKITACSTGETTLKAAPSRVSKPVSPSVSMPNSNNSTTTHSTTMVINTAGGVNSGPISPTTATASHSSTIIRTLQPVTPSPTSPNQQKGSVIDFDSANGEKSVVRSVVTAITGGSNSPQQVVQVTPRVNISASSGTRVYTTTQGGKLTFHVTAPPQPPKKPPQLAVGINSNASSPSGGGVGRGVPPPVPPNKPILPKKDVPVFVQHAVVGGPTSTSSSSSSSSSSSANPVKIAATPISGGALKFGITISKSGNATVTNAVNSGSSPSATTCVVMSSSNSNATAGGATVITATSAVPETTQQSPQMYKETQPVLVTASSIPFENGEEMRSEFRNGSIQSDLLSWTTSSSTTSDEDAEESLAPALADFQQLLVSMASSSPSSRSLSGSSFNVAKSSEKMTNGSSLFSDSLSSSSSSSAEAAAAESWKLESNESSIASTCVSNNSSFDDFKYVSNGDSTLMESTFERMTYNVTMKRALQQTNTCNTSTLPTNLNNCNSGGGGSTGFNPKVRKVVSPTLPKSFNDLKL